MGRSKYVPCACTVRAGTIENTSEEKAGKGAVGRTGREEEGEEEEVKKPNINVLEQQM